MKRHRALLGGALYDSFDPTSWLGLDGNMHRCPYYMRWKAILVRVYSANSLSIDKRYQGSSVCEEWKIFTNFREWMKMQPWQGKELDKDLLGRGAMIYSAETCAFVSKRLNTTITTKPNGSCLLGTTRKNKKFAAQTSDGSGRKIVGICRQTQEQAHFDYLRMKVAQLSTFIGKEDDPRVNDAVEQLCEHLIECIENEIVVSDLYGNLVKI